MSVRMRHTSSHTKNRRSHHALRAASLVKEGESVRLPHRIDEATGMYRGKQIISADALTRRENRLKRNAAKRENPLADTGVIEQPQAAETPQVAPKTQAKEGLLGRFSKGRAKARSGMGGQAG